MDRPLDFLIIGAQKAGTTSLWHALRQHPDIFLSPAKEIHFWSHDEFWNLGPSYLNPFYEDLGDERIIGGSYAHLMFLPQAPERVTSYNRSMKVLACLRDPVSRAYSAYWFARLNGWETEPSFERAIEKESTRSVSGGQAYTELTYLSHGYYAEQLNRWFDCLGPDQVMVIDSQELSTRTNNVVRRVTDWFGVEPVNTSIEHSPANEAAAPRFALLQAIVMKENRVKRLFRQVTSPALRWKIQKNVTEPLSWWNRKPHQYAPINPDTRARLIEHFEPQTRQLESMLGKTFEHWRSIGKT
ncbi:MAG: sulfotransferase domain-containing protein [Burkholderiaceae bacterium]